MNLDGNKCSQGVLDVMPMSPFDLNIEHSLISRDIRALLIEVKANLLTKGVVLAPCTASELAKGSWKVPRMVRSGMSGGLEFYLVQRPYKLAISCSYEIREPEPNDIVFSFKEGHPVLCFPGLKEIDLELIPQPSYYNFKTSSGLDMAGIAQQSFAKLAVGVFGSCCINQNLDMACRFCAIHAARRTDALVKSDVDIIETSKAVADTELTDVIQMVMLGGGTPNNQDRGAKRFSSLAKSIRKLTPWLVSVMMVPPREDGDLILLKDAGVDFISINLEFGTTEAFDSFTPGKSKLIGRERYLSCLESAVSIFGIGNVQSLLVTGLESNEATLEAVEWLACRGIIPVLSPFRPLPSTPLEHTPPPHPDDVIATYYSASKIARHYNLFLGPSCVPCQCNTMSFPWDVKQDSHGS